MVRVGAFGVWSGTAQYLRAAARGCGVIITQGGFLRGKMFKEGVHTGASRHSCLVPICLSKDIIPSGPESPGLKNFFEGYVCGEGDGNINRHKEEWSWRCKTWSPFSRSL